RFAQTQARRKNLCTVFLSLEVLPPLQPGNRSDHFGFSITVVSVERGLDGLIHENLAGSDDQLAALTPGILETQLAENLLDVAEAELRALAQSELGLNTLRVIKQHTARCILVTPC